MSRSNPKAVDATEALKRLQAGNARFAKGQSKHPHASSDWRHVLEAGQHPFAVILGCSDSRVPPELIFDQGLGDLFVARVAGNVVDTDVTASIEYAIEHLETPLIVVLGHTQCGAVTAALDHLATADGEAASDGESTRPSGRTGDLSDRHICDPSQSDRKRRITRGCMPTKRATALPHSSSSLRFAGER